MTPSHHRDELFELLNRLTVETIEPQEQQRLEETFPDDAEACSLIDRPRRAGWELPDIT